MKVPIQKGRIMPSYETYKNADRKEVIRDRQQQVDMLEKNYKLEYETPKQ